MGTSKGQIPPSNGDWSPLKSDITDLVKNIDIGNQEKKQKLTSKVISDFVTAIGGSEGFSSSSRSSKSGGRTTFSSKVGRATASKLGGFFGSVGTGGLQSSFKKLEIDFSNLTIDEIEDKLIEIFSETTNSDDANAANKAMAEVIDELFVGIENIDDLENKILTSLETENILCSFYEKYIFKRFERNLDEYDIQRYGNDTALKIMRDIENYINIRLKTHQCDNKLSDIDFNSNTGEEFVQAVLQEILEQLEVYND
ncbi:hypothetical protein Arnit_0999 [Arcobacter nitrofigilis DSM 7299]|uniref:Uncharacterized protein n=1 Tax=Arcobacter nitrofigilis (strain ATCC 33309 / DSM 7299 / CCUG 15893 / LMG 7604 / NCTC 12251 / CI) TaxID=572480 RepID=D5V380_ARCNC|nr:hypothetical protein [Arcobacter nitrofigilis]ADG92662.1 hypothetical protein Arnit_0999 [Arcobacter nitrofigilis DSM 7299]